MRRASTLDIDGNNGQMALTVANGGTLTLEGELALDEGASLVVEGGGTLRFLCSSPASNDPGSVRGIGSGKWDLKASCAERAPPDLLS